MYNFNVGDVVVNIKEFHLWDNVFHFEKAIQGIRREVVTHACEKYFTTYFTLSDMGVGEFAKLHLYSEIKCHLYRQTDGVQYDDYPTKRDRYVNLTRNRENILGYFNSVFQKRMTQCDANDLQVIQECEAKILQLQTTIEHVKSGRRVFSHMPSIVEREFLMTNRDAILKVLGE